MSKQLTGHALVAYLRDNPTSDAMRAAADEIERLREALETMVEMVEMNGFGRAYAMNVARAALAQGERHETA